MEPADGDSSDKDSRRGGTEKRAENDGRDAKHKEKA